MQIWVIGADGSSDSPVLTTHAVYGNPGLRPELSLRRDVVVQMEDVVRIPRALQRGEASELRVAIDRPGHLGA